MTAGDLKIASLVFAAITASVALNLFFLQEKPGGARIETSALGGTTGSKTFADKVTAALQSDSRDDLGPPLGRGAAALRVLPPKAPNTATNAAEITRGIQRELNARGYEAGQPDGVAGLITRAAIMAYEHDFGLPLTAAPVQDLLSAIVLGSSAPQAVRSATGKAAGADAESVIRSVKQQLAALGYTPGKPDANLTDQTARAIREFEVDQKLPESGRISGPLVSRLIRLQGQVAPAAAAQAKSKSAQK